MDWKPHCYRAGSHLEAVDDLPAGEDLEKFIERSRRYIEPWLSAPTGRRSPPRGHWPIMGSTPDNPIHFILELLWTRFSYAHPVASLFGDDLELEGISDFLEAVPTASSSQPGGLGVDLPLQEPHQGAAGQRPVHAALDARGPGGGAVPCGERLVPWRPFLERPVSHPSGRH